MLKQRPLGVIQDGYGGGADLVKRRIHLEWALRRPLITGDKLIAVEERGGVRIRRPMPDELGTGLHEGN